MKKIIVLLATLSLLVYQFPCVSASEIMPADSYHLTEAELTQIDTSGADCVVKVFSVYPILAFADYVELEKVLEYSHKYDPRILVMHQSTILREYDVCEDGIKEHYFLPDNSANFGERLLCEITEQSAIRLLDENIQIYNAYILSSEPFHPPTEGTAIYYDTNCGVYIYYHYYGAEFLVPLADFIRGVKEYDTLRQTYQSRGDAEELLEKFANYDIHSSNLSLEQAPKLKNVWPIYAAAGCILVVGAVTAIALLRRKKKL